MRWTEASRAALLLAALSVCTAGPAGAQNAPLSANDWLSGKSALPPVSGWRPGDPIPPDAQGRRPPKPRPGALPRTDPRPVAQSGAVAPVGVTRLSDGNPDAKGIISARDARLPADLWGSDSAEAAAAAIAAFTPRLPATRQEMRRILTAQVAPPGAGAEGQLFLARVDRLIALGWVGAARSLLDAAGTGTTARFARRFDIAMIDGEDTAICDLIGAKPGLAPDLAARVFCLAQSGDWSAAALVLHGSTAAGMIPAQTATLLEQFLDDSAVDDGHENEPPRQITPLEFRLHEAIGQPLATNDLPVVYARSDLRPNGGWKARLDAAERLARAGANQLQTLQQAYLEQSPAASGGVWDRARVFQTIWTALETGDNAALSSALPAAQADFARAGMIDPLARLIAPRLPAGGLTPDALEVATHLRLLAGTPTTDAAELTPQDRWLVALAGGKPPGDVPQGLVAEAPVYAAALDDPQAPAGGDVQGSVGLRLLRALADVDSGLDGDSARAAQGLRALVALGQADTARQAALQLILLPHLTPRD